MKRVNMGFSYVWQPAFVFGFMWFVWYALSTLPTTAMLGIVGATSLASSAMIIFTNPFSPAARGGNVIGGYCVGIICGILCHYFAQRWIAGHGQISWIQVFDLTAAIAVAISLFLMCILNLQHPPAAGIALGLVIEPWDVASLTAIFVSIVILSLARVVLKPILRPLI